MIGFMMLIGPSLLFVLTIPVSARLSLGLRRSYLVFGGIIVFIGSGVSIYFASYTGDQGGIAAYFFQSGVIAVYLLLLAVVLGIDFAARVKDKQSMKRNE